MINTTFYNAGAGAGKTYTLTHLLADVIREEKIRPDGVILTTFTKEAAAEFRERAIKVLYEEGMYDEALALEQAKIGTVHSVALDFVKKFWYILGCAQDINVMTAEDTQQLIDRSLANIPTDVELDTLQKLAQELNITTKKENNSTVLDEDFWKDQLKAVINCMLQYGIGNLDSSIEFSKKYIDEIFTEDVILDEKLIDQVLDGIEDVVDTELAAKPDVKTNKNRKKLINYYLMQKQKSLFEVYYSFDPKKKIYDTNFDKNSFEKIAGLDKVMLIHERLSVSKLVGDKLKQCVDIIFSMAERWKDQYEEYKRKHHLIDFNDMEIQLEQLLEVEEVREEIKAQYSHLFIDEFQDSSPLQVRIFEKLSQLVKRTYAVGDPKQAIYDFRGADTALTLSVINDIALENNGNKKAEPLNKSWRSVRELVEMTNDVFTNAFEGTLTKDDVKLTPHRESTELLALRRWQVDGKDQNKGKESNARKANRIMQGIQSILAEDSSAKPSDIAVLARNSNIFAEVEKSLKSNGIPVMRKDNDCSKGEILDLLNACLQLVENDNDNYARLRIAFYTVDRTVAELLDEKLRLEPENKYLENTQLIEQVLQLRPILQKQSLAAMIETLVIETELAAYAAACSATDDVEMQLQSIISVAQAYEQQCMQTMNAATIPGWIEYSTTHPISLKQENAVSLHTIHSSKGLEWKYVILADLEKGFADDIIDRDVFGVKRQKKDGEMLIHYLQKIGGISDLRNAKIKNTTLYKQRESAKCEEEKRLMYVAFTRAKDVLILASASDDMKQLSDAGINMNIVRSSAGTSMEKVIDSFGKPKHFDIIGDKSSTTEIEIPIVTKPEAPNFLETLRRDVAPSKVVPCECNVSVVEHEQEGSRIRVNELRHIASETERYQILGDYIHQALCGIEYLSDSQIDSLIAAWGLKDILTAQQIRQTWERLMQLLQKHYGSTCGCVHECAFHHHRDGQIIIGSIDLVYHLNDHEVVLVDYKTCPAGEKAIIDPAHALYAGKYSGQLATYKAALEAAGKSVKATVIYYPISGMLVAIE
jgi:ATP-dependent exoDNAse (exonuclease V) beta subunit